MSSFSSKISLILSFLTLLIGHLHSQISHELQGRNVSHINLDDFGRPIVFSQFQVCQTNKGKFLCEEPRIPRVNAFEVLTSGDLLIASDKGFYKKVFQDLIPVHPPREGGFKKVFDLKSLRSKTFLATDNGVWEYDNILQKVTIKKPYNDIDNHQLVLIQNKLFTVVSNALINVQDSSEILILPQRINAVFASDELSLVGVEENGLFIQTEDGFKKYFNPTMEIGNYIKNIIGDMYNVIIHSEKGMFRWHLASSEITKIDLPTDLYRFQINDIEIDEWGFLHVATANGLYRFNVDPTLQDEMPKALQQSFVISDANDQPVQLQKQKVHLTEAMNILKIDPAFYHPKNDLKLQYKYENSAWKDSDFNQTIVLANLASGKSELKIRASADGKHYCNPISISVVKPEKSFWLNLLPFLGVGLLILGVWFYSYRRMGRANNAILAQRDKLKLENEKLKLERKTLQLQMNPHFLFNALNSIQGLIALGDNKNARKQLGTFSKMMRTVLNQSRTEWITMEDEIKFLNQYLSLEQLCRDNKFDFDIESNVDDELLIPPMIIQAFVENAIIHGVSPLKNKGMIQVVFTHKENKVECIVDDNGVGRHSAAAKKQSSHQSVALELIKERLQRGFKNKKENFVVFEDKLNSQNESLGTRVTIHLPTA